MTQAGMILGTAAYMSPELVRGKTVDKRADIWAFGCVLYEILTGARLFAGDSVPETLGLILSHEPDLARLPATAPARVRTLICGASSKIPVSACATSAMRGWIWRTRAARPSPPRQCPLPHVRARVAVGSGRSCRYCLPDGPSGAVQQAA